MSGVFVNIPVHNNLKSVEECIAAVVDACEYAERDYTISVVDDHSDSETLSGLIELNNIYFAHMVLMHTKLRTKSPSPNLGLAVNMGLEAFQYSGCDWFWNVETDVYPQRTCLAELIYALEQQPEVGMACPLFIDPEKKKTRHVFPGPEGIALAGQPIEVAPQDTRYVPWHHAGANIVPGEIAKDPRCRVDESFKLWCCDFDWAWCVEDIFEKKLLYVGKAQAVHVGCMSSSKVDRDSFESETEANRRVREKWHREHL